MANEQRQRKMRFRQIRKFLRTTFIGGVLVILPISIFIFLIKIVFDFIRNLVEPIAKWINFGDFTNAFLSDLIAFSILVAFCFIVGLTVQTRSGKWLFNSLDNMLLNRLPFYSTIKETVQQFSGANKVPFSQVVLVDVFNSGTRMIGFVSDEHENGNYTLFVPTGPNPTNGFIFYVKPEQVEMVDIKPEEAMRTIIGVGAGASKII